MDEVISHNDIEIKGFFEEYRWLSNFTETDIVWMNLHFHNVEAAYQASKCTNIKEAKLFCPMSGSQAKKASKNIIERPDWKFVRYDIMSQLVFQKFLKNLELREKLVDTWPKLLEETNTWNDTYWGVCKGKGYNNLGKILMSTREYFKMLEYNDND